MARHTAKSHKIRKVEILVIQMEILSDYQLSFVIYSCIKKNTNTLKSIVTIPIMINIMEVKLFERDCN